MVFCAEKAICCGADLMAFRVISIISEKPRSALPHLVALGIIVIVSAEETWPTFSYLMALAIIVDNIAKQPFAAISTF